VPYNDDARLGPTVLIHECSNHPHGPSSFGIKGLFASAVPRLVGKYVDASDAEEGTLVRVLVRSIHEL